MIINNLVQHIQTPQHRSHYTFNKNTTYLITIIYQTNITCSKTKPFAKSSSCSSSPPLSLVLPLPLPLTIVCLPPPIELVPFSAPLAPLPLLLALVPCTRYCCRSRSPAQPPAAHPASPPAARPACSPDRSSLLLTRTASNWLAHAYARVSLGFARATIRLMAQLRLMSEGQ
jgi:hypothetical protein